MNNKEFKFNDNALKMLKIIKLKTPDADDEVWKFVNLDRHPEYTKQHRYLVSNLARVYDCKRKRLIFAYRKTTNATGEYYYEVRLRFNDEFVRYSLHRLVALAFIPIDETRPFVNHKDGHPSNNRLYNLEWTTQSENTLHAVRTGLKVDSHGEKRSNAKWTDEEVKLICSMMAEGHKATYIYNKLLQILDDPKVQYERVRTLYKHIRNKTHWTHISKYYDINYSKYNFLKEKGSVINKQRMNNEAGSTTMES